MTHLFVVRKCSRTGCNNRQPWHMMFDVNGGVRVCRTCFIAKNRMIQRNTDQDDTQMIEWFENELKGSAA